MASTDIPPKKQEGAVRIVPPHEETTHLPVNEFVTNASTKDQANLARLLIVGLFASIAFHYIAVILFVINKIDTKELAGVFNGWLPVLSGFVGSAVTYYFTKQNDPKK